MIFSSIVAAGFVLAASTVASVVGLVAVARDSRDDGDCDLRCSGRRPNSVFDAAEGRCIFDGAFWMLPPAL